MGYKSHPVLVEPKDDQPLWRYLDFAKFTWMLQKQSLYLPSLASFQRIDPWEGLPARMNFDPNLKVPLTVDGSDTTPTALKDVLGKSFEGYISAMKASAPAIQRALFASCWHMNDSESDSQWKIYGPNQYSLAIVTSFGQLKSSIRDAKDVSGAIVHYFDPETEGTPTNNLFFSAIHKRWAFSHEREFRLIHLGFDYIQDKVAPPGIEIKVDLLHTIERIVISPLAPTWFAEVVAAEIAHKNLSCPVRKSNLLEPPF